MSVTLAASPAAMPKPDITLDAISAASPSPRALARARFNTSGIAAIESRAVKPACARNAMPSPACAAVNAVVAPSSRAILVIWVISSPVALLIAPTRDIAAPNSDTVLNTALSARPADTMATNPPTAPPTARPTPAYDRESCSFSLLSLSVVRVVSFASLLNCLSDRSALSTSFAFTLSVTSATSKDLLLVYFCLRAIVASCSFALALR